MPNRPPKTTMANTTQKGLMPKEPPKIFGQSQRPSNCWSTNIKIATQMAGYRPPVHQMGRQTYAQQHAVLLVYGVLWEQQSPILRYTFVTTPSRKPFNQCGRGCGCCIGRFRTRSSFDNEQYLLSYVPRGTGENEPSNRRGFGIWPKEKAGSWQISTTCVKTTIKTKFSK